MGVPGVRLYHDQALYKEPGGGFTPWHADQFYWPLASPNTCTAWVPLQATPHGDGAARLLGRQPPVQCRGANWASATSPRRRSAGPPGRRPADGGKPFDLGDVSFHYGWTFHRAGANRTESPRRVMTVIYMEDDMRLTEPKNNNQMADWNTWLPGVEIGAVADSPLNPVLYHADGEGEGTDGEGRG